MKRIAVFLLTSIIYVSAFTQGIGVGIAVPLAKLHIKGSEDTVQLAIDANIVQSNTRPLIKLRNSDGVELFRIHSDDVSNIFIGQFAGRVNKVINGTGVSNVFIGSKSGYFNTDGYNNTAVGEHALYSNINGFFNVAVGSSALYSNQFGYNNTAVGSESLYSNLSGIENTAVGSSALYANTNGRSNTAIGLQALYSNTSGNNNTAMGLSSLGTNGSGSDNTALGSIALKNNFTGDGNTAVGMEALFNNTTGSTNTAHGFQALFNNTTGTQNTAVGSYALTDVTTSSYNTAVGSGAGNGSIYDMGWNNTLIGANTQANFPGIFNSIALGESAITTASNQARIGNSSTVSIGGYTNWTNISDGRVKKNIVENVPGLVFINKLRPVTYNLDLTAAEKIMQVKIEKAGKTDGSFIQFEKEARAAKEKIVYSGFIAQEVEIAAKELGYNFSGVDLPKNDKDLYGLRYAEFVVPLVKAVQELSKGNDELLKRIVKLEQQLGLINQ